jgi:hypothetical protein
VVSTLPLIPSSLRRRLHEPEAVKGGETRDGQIVLTSISGTHSSKMWNRASVDSKREMVRWTIRYLNRIGRDHYGPENKSLKDQKFISAVDLI